MPRGLSRQRDQPRRGGRRGMLAVAATCVGLGLTVGLGGWWLGWFRRGDAGDNGRAARGPRTAGGDSGGSREQRWTKWVLDRSTPEQRARITEYIAAFERRLAETGRTL